MLVLKLNCYAFNVFIDLITSVFHSEDKMNRVFEVKHLNPNKVSFRA